VPSEGDRARVKDIRRAVAKVLEYSKGLDEAEFSARDELVDAVVYNLIIIGEAATQVTSAFAQVHTDIPWRVMRGMRNILVHAYWRVDRKLVWKTIQDDLPPLEVALDDLMRREFPSQ
jgi:uncharacterized protein with HEPN domain